MNSKYLFTLVMAALLSSCSDSPKVISADSNTQELSFTPTVPIDATPKQNFTDSVHEVEVVEKMEADKYLYLKVNEHQKFYWMAIPNQEIILGTTYYYSNALLKTGFKSKVYNKVFDSIYLVSKIVPKLHGRETNQTSLPTNALIEEDSKNEMVAQENSPLVEAPISIKELVLHKDTYAGKRVRIRATCTKINPGIMNRNWIHLNDNSYNEFDLVITSDSFISVGKTVTFEAGVSLNRDFGAGYHYDLILENGKVISQ